MPGVPPRIVIVTTGTSGFTPQDPILELEPTPEGDARTVTVPMRPTAAPRGLSTALGS